MSNLNQPVDLIAHDQAGRAILVAEVKSRSGTSEEWAARFRRNILAHESLPSPHFFLIATPERMYFWTPEQTSAREELPAFTLDTATALKPYLSRWDKPPQTVGEEALERMIWSWLNDISTAGGTSARHDPATRWLADSGLIDALESARIELTAV